ncbi:MAG: methionine gamma-lyase family protein [Clostridia bacterium]
MQCGSLIKNMGGGLAQMGGYIVGKKKYIELCADKLTCPGVGRECGATLGQNSNILQGVFMAPSTVKNALKIAILTASMLEKQGFDIYPGVFDKRSDIVQTVKFNDPGKLVKFVQGIQSASPVDSNVTPYPWDMPGYTDKVIMAAGTFIEGATIELSADGPLRPPYTAYLQGSLTYESGKIALCKAIQEMKAEEIK